MKKVSTQIVAFKMSPLFLLKNRPRLLCCLGILISLLLNIALVFDLFSKSQNQKSNLEWLTNRKVFESQLFRDDISILTELSPRPDSIFFVETSGADSLNDKQCCAIESAARHHPNQQIYVVMTSPFVDQKTGRLPSLTRNLTNLQIKYLNVDSFIQGTSLESLWQNDVIISSRHLVSHLSDVLRFLILSRFGGTYLDSDVIVLKPLPNFYNFVGRESWTHPFVAAGVMCFQLGHPILEEFVRELSANFDGNDWGANGPKLVTRVLQRFCQIEDLGKMNPENCLGIKVLPPEAFYPIPWRQWKSYFNENDSQKVLDQIENSYIAHVWGKHSSDSTFKGTKNAYSLLAQKHCPLTYFEN